jgi:hypothetical protein
MLAEVICKAPCGRKVGAAWKVRGRTREVGEYSPSIGEAADGKVRVRRHADREQASGHFADLIARRIWSDATPTTRRRDRGSGIRLRRSPQRIAVGAR